VTSDRYTSSRDFVFLIALPLQEPSYLIGT
jgi:hypothetical protein